MEAYRTSPMAQPKGSPRIQPECRVVANTGGSGHRLATPELPPRTDIRGRTSAFLDFRRLYPLFCCKTIWQAVKRSNRIETTDAATHSCREGRGDESMLRGFSVDGVLQHYPPRNRRSRWGRGRAACDPGCVKTNSWRPRRNIES